MSDRDEAALIRMLAGAADTAPEPGENLAGAVERRLHRRRARRRLRVVLAAAGVIVVVGGTTAVVKGAFSRGGGEGQMLTMATPGGTAHPTIFSAPASPVPTPAPSVGGGKDGAGVRPAAEIWPSAVSTVPARAADGWSYRPVTGLSATELLLIAESSFEKAGRLEVYDTATGRSTVLGGIPEPPGVKGYFPQDFEVGTDYIAWFGTTPNHGDRWADFWVMPRLGGTARRVGEVDGDMAEVERIGVDRDHVFWSAREGGVYRMPILGGAAESVAGTEGLHLLSWPWAGDAAERYGGTGNQKVLLNVRTGERRTPEVPEGVVGLRCSEVWCVGRKGEGVIVQRVDGSAGRYVRDLAGAAGLPVVQGRYREFSALGPGRTTFSAILYDLATGEAAGIGWMSRDGTVGGRGTGVSSSPSSIYYWRAGTVPTRRVCHGDTSATRSCGTEEVGRAKEYTVVNLLAVPPAE